MTKIYALLAVMLFASSMNAQSICNDFDANENVPFVDSDPDPTIVANNHIGGINASVTETSRFNESVVEKGIYFLSLLDKISNKTNFKKVDCQAINHITNENIPGACLFQLCT